MELVISDGADFKLRAGGAEPIDQKTREMRKQAADETRRMEAELERLQEQAMLAQEMETWPEQVVWHCSTVALMWHCVDGIDVALMWHCINGIDVALH